MARSRFSLLMLVAGASVLAVTIACRSEAAHDDDDDDDHAPKAAVSAAALEKGRSTYKTTCAPCHGDTGKGDGPASKIFKPAPRDHTDAAYMNTISDEDLAKIIQMGGALRGKPLMPSTPQIRGEEMTALVAYVRTLSRHAK